MHVDMTGEAFWEHLHLSLIVGLGVAGPAIRNLPMLRVTRPARNLAVLADRTLPFTIDLGMTAVTGLDIGINRQVDLHRIMHLLMATGAGNKRLPLVMGIMAF